MPLKKGVQRKTKLKRGLLFQVTALELKESKLSACEFYWSPAHPHTHRNLYFGFSLIFMAIFEASFI